MIQKVTPDGVEEFEKVYFKPLNKYGLTHTTIYKRSK